MPEVKIVGRGVDTLVLNVCYADRHFQPIKQELGEGLQNELNLLQTAARLTEAPILTRWAFKGINLFMQEKGSRGQWRWLLKSPLLSLAISRGRLSRIMAQMRLSSEYLWSCEFLAEPIVEVGLFLYSMFGDYLWFQVSEVDLSADVVGWDASQANWQDCFISRAASDDGRSRKDALPSFFTNRLVERSGNEYPTISPLNLTRSQVILMTASACLVVWFKSPREANSIL